MISNFIQNMNEQKPGRRMPPSLVTARSKHNKKHLNTKDLELTRNPAFLDGTQDIFDVLATHAQEKDIMERNIGATIALLKRSSIMLQDAENTIEAQSKKLKKLEALTVTDEISGLLNHRGFVQAFVKEVARTNRGHNDGGLLVMFNLENLASIKKNSGRDAVDMAIKLVSKALEGEIRETDYAARIYDDEFVLLFTNTGMKNALSRLQNMALRLNQLSLVWNGQEIPLNLSLGLKSFSAHERAEDIFELASEDLQRNRKDQTKTKS